MKTKMALFTRRSFSAGVLLLVVATMISSCTKPQKGDTGPAGPAGTNGTNGNANVKSTQVSVTAANWTYVSPAYQTTLAFSEITSDIINTGAVLVYMKTTTGTWSQLPFTYYPAASYSSTLKTESYVGNVMVVVTDSDLTQPTNPGSITFKIVAISSSMLAKHPGLDTRDFEKMKEFFQL